MPYATLTKSRLSVKKTQVPPRRETASHSPGIVSRAAYLGTLKRELAFNPFQGGRGSRESMAGQDSAGLPDADTAQLPARLRTSKATTVQDSGTAGPPSVLSGPSLNKADAKAAKRRRQTMLNSDISHTYPTKTTGPTPQMTPCLRTTLNTGQPPSLRVSRQHTFGNPTSGSEQPKLGSCEGHPKPKKLVPQAPTPASHTR